MKHSEYEITSYREEFKSGVLDVLQYLWSENHARNQNCFDWKYIANPYTDSPLGIVALHGGTVVGFRGYFATLWQIGDTGESLIVLVPGDTCVHPDHRRKGLSVIMGKRASADYASRCRLFMNFTSTRHSLPGYLKLGFVPLVDKVYLTRCSLWGLGKYCLSGRQSRPLSECRVRFGRFDGIEVLGHAKPLEMASIIRQQQADGRIAIHQDERFFRWRFDNPMKKHVFYYRRESDTVTGYVVIGLSSNNRRAYVLDFTDSDGQSVAELMRWLTLSRCFDLISVYQHAADEKLLRTSRSLRLKANGLAQTIEKRLIGTLPVLIRPIRPAFSERDWFIGDRDLRAIENWSFKGICGDDA